MASNVRMKRLMMKLKRQKGLPFVKECLRVHNKYRAIHGSTPLRLNSEITSYAQEWANSLAKREAFEHRPDCLYGENLFSAFDDSDEWLILASDPVRCWYSEIELYTFDEFLVQPKTSNTGRFTQMIWKSTLELGVGISLHFSGRVYIVCCYDPVGNISGNYNANVLPPAKAAKYKDKALRCYFSDIDSNGKDSNVY
ncbi:Golgi-associated plant pathogenesis-related protein 1-like [Neodiprion pinetum]|uniref:Golgi-associated plant pathogenesis-related protein 1-like n=1 Tax=Neodiprion pinetum TaxID=441929 RepID=UPI003713FC6C